MAKPQVSTEWATNTIAEQVPDDKGNIELALNKQEPSTSYKESGIRSKSPVFRPYVNYWKNSVHRLLEWVIEEEVGTILEFELGAMTSQQLEADRGGVWEDLGTTSRAYTNTTVTVQGFKKTS